MFVARMTIGNWARGKLVENLDSMLKASSTASYRLALTA